MKVYLLWGEHGEYSDHRSWVHSVYTDANTAATRCAELGESLTTLYRQKDEAEDWNMESRIQDEIEKLDPLGRPRSLDPPSYSVEEKELIV